MRYMTQEMMKAGVLAGPKQIVMKEIPVPAVGPGQIKIKVSAAVISICGRPGRAGDQTMARIS